MPGYFWDTSALVKHYHPELGTPEVDHLLQTPDSQHAISRLAVTETFSVFAGKVRARMEFDQLCRRFLADTERKLFSVARLLVAHHKEAERLLPRIRQHLRKRSYPFPGSCKPFGKRRPPAGESSLLPRRLKR